MASGGQIPFAHLSRPLLAVLLVLALVAWACGGTMPPPPSVADQLDVAIGKIEQGYGAGKDAAEAMCAVYPRTCDSFHASERAVESTINAASAAVAAYRLGQKTYAEAADAVLEAVKAAKAFLAFVEASQRSVT